MSEKDMDRFIDISLRSVQMAGAVVESMTSALVEFLKFRAANQNDKAIVKYYKSGGKLSVSMCSPEEMKKISSWLKENDVTHSCIIQEREVDGTKIGLILYPEKEEEKVKKLLDQYRAEHTRGGMTKKEVLWYKSNGHLRKIKDLDKATAMLMEEHARKKKLDYYIEEPKVGKFNIVYCTQDQNVMTQVKAEVAIDLAGKSGDALKKQLEYEDKNTVEIFEKISDPKTDALVVVDLDGNAIQISENAVKISGSETIELARNTGNAEIDKKTMTQIKCALSCMRTPVYMNEENYEKYKKLLTNEKIQFLAELEKEHGRPQYTKEEYADIKAKETLREEYITKILRERGSSVLESPFSNNELRGASIQKEEYEKYELKEEIILEARKTYYEFEDAAEITPIDAEREADLILDGEELDLYRQEGIDLERESDLDRLYDTNGDGFNNEFEEELD